MLIGMVKFEKSQTIIYDVSALATLLSYLALFVTTSAIIDQFHAS